MSGIVRTMASPSNQKSALGCLLLSAILCSCANMPSDESMISQFDSQRSSFEKIVEMAQGEHGVERISSTFVRLDGIMMPTDAQRLGAISDARLREYRGLFQKIHDPNGIGLAPGRTYFYLHDAGIAGSGVSKGIVWSRQSPGKLVDNLDRFARGSPGKDAEAWRQIGDGWYLEYDSN
jgi:hypothetical protein